MAEPESVLVTSDGGAVTVTLHRPAQHNALTRAMIARLTALFRELHEQDEVRVVVVTGHGRSFCAGADLGEMRAAADFTFDQNVADAEAIFDLMAAVDSCSKPVIGRVNGAAIGGGAGLISCCDIAVAAASASFAFSETRLGLVPAVISPFVLARIGVSAARELFLTGERFDAARAREIGLVQHVAVAADLDEMVQERVKALLAGAPGAQAAAKALIRRVAYQPKASMRAATAELIALRRESQEGREGMSAFLQKRPPVWQS